MVLVDTNVLLDVLEDDRRWGEWSQHALEAASLADKLVITVRAVEKYVSSIFGKLGLPSTGTESRRVLAVLAFLRA